MSQRLLVADVSVPDDKKKHDVAIYDAVVHEKMNNKEIVRTLEKDWVMFQRLGFTWGPNKEDNQMVYPMLVGPWRVSIEDFGFFENKVLRILDRLFIELRKWFPNARSLAWGFPDCIWTFSNFNSDSSVSHPTRKQLIKWLTRENRLKQKRRSGLANRRHS